MIVVLAVVVVVNEVGLCGTVVERKMEREEGGEGGREGGGREQSTQTESRAE